MTIPLLLVCDGAESKQASLEGLVKNEPGLKYIATVSMQEGTRAVERAVKVGARLIWIDLDEEPVEGLNLLAETRKLHPMLSVIVSRTQIDPDMVRAALQLGALDFLDPARATQQLHVVVENLTISAQQTQVAAAPAGPAHVAMAAETAAQLPALPAQNPNAAPSLAGAGGGKWADLDSIPTPGAKGALPVGQDVTGEIHVANSGIQNLVASQAITGAPAAQSAQVVAAAQGSPAAVHPTTELPAAGSKWGDLDSIGAPSAAAAPAAPVQAPAPVAPMAPMPAPAAPVAAQAPVAPMAAPAPAPPMAAPAPAAPMAAPAPAAPAAAPAPPAAAQAPVAAMAAPAPAAPAPAPDASNAAAGSGGNNFNGGKWGDLDAIPTPKAALEPTAPKATGELAKPLSALDAIPSPSAVPAAPLARPEPHLNTNKALRPSPEKAELYSMGSPVMMAVVIILIIFGAIAFMLFKQHSAPGATTPTASPAPTSAAPTSPAPTIAAPTSSPAPTSPAATQPPR